MAQMLVLMLLSVFPFLILHDLANEIRRCSQTKRERRIADKSFRERLLLKGYADGIKKHGRMMRYAVIMNRILLIYFAVLPPAVMLWAFCPPVRTYVKAVLIVKALLLDGQVFVFALLNSRHQKNGGVGWRM